MLAAIDVWASGTAASAAQVARHLAVNVTPREAVIEVVFDVYDKGDVEVTTPMVWVARLGDWRLDVPASGSISSSVVDPSLAGYVAWRLS